MGVVDEQADDSMPPPFHRVFGQNFDEQLLLRLCREGPRRGERGLTGDIKLIWDYSRGHALWPNALRGDFDTSAAFIRRWLAACDDLDGPAWTCAMDVAIRATNWIFADTISGGEISRRIGSETWARWLWTHGQTIWQRLEIRMVCSNHYLADLLGLAVIGSVFPADSNARRWRTFAQREFPCALVAQTRADGGLNEASTRYHVFVTEMALLTRLALAMPFSPAAEERLRRMVQIVADLRDCQGDVFALGDDDSGHVLDWDWAGRKGRGDLIVQLATSWLRTRFAPAPEAIHTDSGWWVRRVGDFTFVLEFGGVGLAGHGAHAHNDDLSICLEWRGRPVIVDPGTYLYTSDQEARNAFRSARAHNTVVIDDREPRDLVPGPFCLSGADEALRFETSAPDARAFDRSLPHSATHRRTVKVTAETIALEDEIRGTGEHQLDWRFHLHPTVQAVIHEGIVRLEVPGAGHLELRTPAGILPQIEPSRFSPGYGRETPTSVIVARTRCKLPFVGSWVIRPASTVLG